ncbi:MAG: hypothetical protein ACREM3_00800 [Candidatus Rokuibacteriota bacterium]
MSLWVIVSAVTPSVGRCPATPSNTTRAILPAVPIAPVRFAPPTVIRPVKTTELPV